MSGRVGRRVCRALTAALAGLLLLVAPVGHAQVTGGHGQAAVQTSVAHDAVVVAPSTRAAAGRTGSLSTDAAVASTPIRPTSRLGYEPSRRLELADRSADDTAAARAPPLKD